MAISTGSKAGTMRAAQIARAGAPFEIVELPIPQPEPGQVRVKVQACGVCHSDSLTKEGHFPGIPYPISPGHEVIGLLDALGEGVDQWTLGQRVGLGWYGGHCAKCEPCRRGDLVRCQKHIISGISFSGGYAEYLVAPAVALAAVPAALTSTEAAPLLCAGVTTFNAMRNSGARPGDLVAVLGMGGLGHLGVQYCAKMGFATAAIARGAEKAQAASQLGAAHYIDSTQQDVGAELTRLGGARVILATVTDAPAMSAAAAGLGYAGELIVVGVPMEPLQISALNLIMNHQSVYGSASGAAIDSEDTLRFSAMHHVVPIIERYPLEKAAEAYDRMMSGKARYRVVLDMSA